jgi:hypothetical protein
MKVEEFYYLGEISVRTLNICRGNNLNDLKLILTYYQSKRNFLNLRNCGGKSNEELIAVCLKYMDYDILQYYEPLKLENELIKTINGFTRIKRETVNSFIELNADNLSNRGKNTISSYLNGNFKIQNISERILFNYKFNFKNLKNVGTKTIIELKSFVDSITDFIEKVKDVENEIDLIALRNKFFIEKTFSLTSIPNDILESQSVFKLTNFLLEKDVIFEKKRSVIFKKLFKIYNNQPEFTIDKIALELNISNQGVFNQKKRFLENFLYNFQFTKQIGDNFFETYKIERSQNFIIIENQTNDQINLVNETSFSKQFNTFLIYSVYSDIFDLIGEIDDVLQSKYFNSRERHNWQNFYIIGKALTIEFDFNKFTNDVKSRLLDRIEETYFFNFKSYLSNFLTSEKYDILSIITPIAEIIINQEFELFINLNDEIVFKRNTIKPISEYAIEALEVLGKPSKIEDIYRIIENIDQDITKSSESLRGSLKKTPEIIYFGRSSTYGLKKWEIEKEGIKGGTIKDIILEYLLDKTAPIHILELLNEVHKYREKTSAKNIITNLKLDPQKQFIIFNQSFIGLSGKTYISNLTSLPKFLGKSITYYINQQKCTNRTKIEEYFSIQLKIDMKNMIYIIDHLIEQQFVFIDNQNNLSI